MLKFLHDTLREHHPLAKIYATASEIFDQLEENDQKKFRLLLVETNRAGTERQLQLDDETFKPVDVKQYTTADKLKGLDIHPGRIVFPTTAGNKLVSQVAHYLTFQITLIYYRSIWMMALIYCQIHFDMMQF